MFKIIFYILAFLPIYLAGDFNRKLFQEAYDSGNIVKFIIGILIILGMILIGLFIAGLGYKIDDKLESLKKKNR